ncbi:M48 family metallopeptidase [Ferrimonas gelatinilytica]|uniref:M48 family metallopeptidase n=1 Tax=Ferrimonas gelatinilytica TaxID=1255257 RepID=A0ABP9S091_9GAMM
MDFFAQQDQARRRTWHLILLFILAVTAIVIVINAVVASVLMPATPQSQADPLNAVIDGMLSDRGAAITAAVVAVILLVSLFKWAALRGGGSRIAESLGGRRIPPNTEDPDEKRLRNVVEEMALASGLPVPRVYLLDNEAGINAFAAGHGPADAVIGVTRGCLEQMDRDQLQGVIAHEFSHILNGDMRLNLRLIAVLAGILFLSQIGELVVHGSRGRSKESNQAAIIGLALLLLGWIGTTFGRMIQSAVSRQREYLADASAVQYTRNPTGIAEALKLIGAHQSGSRVDHPKASETSHLFFGAYRPLRGLFATHPPLEKRIRAIEPGWDGQYAPTVNAMQRRLARRQSLEAAGGEGRSPSPSALSGSGASHPLQAAALLAALPDALQSDSHEPEGARELALALMWPDSESHSIPELAPAVMQGILKRRDAVRTLSKLQQLQLLQLSMPALMELSEPQRRLLMQQVEACWSHGESRLLRWCFCQLLRHYLLETGGRPAGPKAHERAATQLMALLAQADGGGESSAAEQPQEVKKAFYRGLNSLGAYNSDWPERLDWAQASEAVPLLRASKPLYKQRLMRAFKHCIEQDGQITESEQVLTQTLAWILDAPQTE